MVIFPKKTLKTLLFASLLCLSCNATSYALEAGSKAPDFSLPGVQGTVDLSSTAGSVVYVDFWASWCTTCKHSFGWMNAMQDKYRAKGLKIIGINVGEKTDVARKFLVQTPAHFTVAFDEKGVTPKNYGVKQGMPNSFLVGRDGKVIFQHIGFKETDREELEKQINAALEAKK